MTRKEERKMEKMREKIEEQNQKSSMVVHPGFWGTVADSPCGIYLYYPSVACRHVLRFRWIHLAFP